MPAPAFRTSDLKFLTPSQVWMASTHWNVFGQSTPGVPTHGLTLTLRLQGPLTSLKSAGFGRGGPDWTAAFGAKMDGLKRRRLIRSRMRRMVHCSFLVGQPDHHSRLTGSKGPPESRFWSTCRADGQPDR